MTTPLLLGIEIGGTKLQLGLGQGDGSILALCRLTVDPPRGAEGIRLQISEAIDPLLASLGASRTDLTAVGIGFGGPVDATRGIVTKSNQIAGWDEFPLADWVRSATGLTRVSLQNDADTAALGEARFGAGVGLSPVLYVTIGSGIGGGLVIDGRIYRGSGAGALEIGHVLVEEGEGRARTLEQVASGWSIGRAGRFGTAVAVAEAAGEGDSEAHAILDRTTLAMGRALSWAVNLLAPRRIILGGGVSLIGEALWFEPIRRAIDERIFPPFRGSFDVIAAELGEEVVVHGALALARDLMASD